ncbi:MAG: beta-lactamase family protein [Bacteroidales bacterium]|nr:beta-lactamase family protein [Bacteroidales bacterium]
MRSRRRTGFIKTAAAAAAGVAALLLLFIFIGRKQKDEVRVPINLNATLTNAMSDTSSLARMDKAIENYMVQWGLRGSSLAIMKNDSLVYAKGYGWADEEEEMHMEPGKVMRLASVSKLLTATGIMVLRERGQLSLDDKVFGPEGILNDPEFTAVIKDTNCFNITVEHLLRHQGGFTTRAGDPMFVTGTIMLQNRLKEAPDHDTLTKIVLRRRLGFKPGTSQDYSNFGYMLLSMVIEHVTGEDYESWMQDNVLRPAGCVDMHIGENYYHEKRENEVKYYVHLKDELVDEFNNSGHKVVRCYGGSDFKALSGAGAWIASAPELALFVASIDGRPEVPDIISEESVREMTRYIDENTYSLGWNDTREDGTWTRTGTLSCTSALIKYYPDGECWILVTNTGTWKGPRFTKYTSTLFNRLRDKYSPLLPERDFFYAPTPEKESGRGRKARKS